jgi:hypothetical protein
MGYERIPAKYVAGKTGLTTGELPVNYIHRDDVIGVIEAFLQTPTPLEYNLQRSRSASSYTPGKSIWRVAPLSAMSLQRLQEAELNPFKVISSQKLQNALAYRFVYPNPLEFFYQLYDFLFNACL